MNRTEDLIFDRNIGHPRILIWLALPVQLGDPPHFRLEFLTVDFTFESHGDFQVEGNSVIAYAIAAAYTNLGEVLFRQVVNLGSAALSYF